MKLLKGDPSKIGLYHYSSLVLIVLFKVVPIFAALVLGGNYIKDLFDKIPPVIMTGLNVAGGMLPAIGFAMLLNMMLKKNMWPYLLVGFVFSAFLKFINNWYSFIRCCNRILTFNEIKFSSNI